MPISERKILKNFLVKGQNVAAVFSRQKKDKRKSNSTRQKNKAVYSKVESNASPEIPDGRRHQTSPAFIRGLTWGACWVNTQQCFRNSPNSDVNYRIFNVRTDINACNCTRGCTDTVRESAQKVDSGESNVRQRRVGPTLYQLSYIPIVLQLLSLL